MTQSPRISVIIPYRDVADFLPQALASLETQTFRDFEVILVDDGSVQSWAGPGPGESTGAALVFRHLRQQAKGVSSARNLGAREARGEYLAFLDADDAWLPGKLETQYMAMWPMPSVAFSYGNAQFIDERGQLKGKDFRLHFGLRSLPDGDVGDVMFIKSFVLPSTLMMRRETYLELGGFDESLGVGEDWDFALRACRRGPLIALQEPLVLYRRHARGATVTRPDGRAQVLSIIEKWLADRDVTEQARWWAHHRARFLVEDASIAVGQHRWGRALRNLLQAASIQPKTAVREVRVRFDCLVAQLTHRFVRGREFPEKQSGAKRR